VAPSDISLVDVNGDGLRDIVVTDQASGDVTVFLNDSSHTFSTSYRFRAGTGPFGLDPTATTTAVASEDQPVSLVAGDVTGNGRNDLVVVDRGTHSFSVLVNDGNGGFANPQPALTASTSDGQTINDRAGPIVAGYFQGTGKPLDLAILMEDSAEVWIYTGNGDGTFTHTSSINAGNLPTGLSVVANPSTGHLDLVVGTQFGDVLRLAGNGDGTFQPPPHATGTRESLDVVDLAGNGTDDVILGNQKDSTISIQAPTGLKYHPLSSLAATDASTQLAPGAVQWMKLEGPSSPFYDAIVLASGSNDLLVFHGTGFDAAGTPTFAPPIPYSVGTDPVGLTIADINGDGIPDLLVANQGSNDVSVLFGSIVDGQWHGTPGPLLKSNGEAPIAVSLLKDAASPGGYDLAITNAVTGTVAVLSGRGQGFFNDVSPHIVNLGATIVQAPGLLGTNGIVLTSSGEIISVDLQTFSSSVVFRAPEGQGINTLEPLSDGSVVIAESDGTIEKLGLDSSGQCQVTETFTSFDGTCDSPSALVVLSTGNDEKVLVTSAGQDNVFVFTLLSPETSTTAAEQSASLTTATTVTTADFTFITTSAADEALAVVVTVVADTLPESTGGSTAQLLQAAQQTPTGGDEDDAPALNAVAYVPAKGLPPGVDDVLPKVDLYKPTDEPKLPGPVSRRRFFEDSWSTDRAVVREVPAEIAVAVLAARAAAQDTDWRAGRVNALSPFEQADTASPPTEAPLEELASPTHANEDGAFTRLAPQTDDWACLLAALAGLGLVGALPDRTPRRRSLPWAVSKQGEES
jgi:hypothetical protein